MRIFLFLFICIYIYAICFLTIVQKHDFLVVIWEGQHVGITVVLVMFYEMRVFSQIVFL